MYFCLPAEGVNVNELLNDPEVLGAMSDHTESTDVSLYLPKFKVTATSDLAAFLLSAGVTDAFDPVHADFSPLTDDGSLYVNQAKQKAMVEIDEKGVRGAAYTYVEMVGSSAIPDPVEVIFDRPFLFAVTGKDDSILFSGIIRNIQ